MAPGFHRNRAPLAAALCAAPWLLSGTAGPRVVSPPSSVTQAPARADACVSCHREAVASWRASLHARSWSDPIFLAAYREEPMAFCRSCHAPLGDPAREPDRAARDEGVSCVACHARASAHLAARGRVPATDATRDGDAGCARCHQFNFPVDRGPGRPLWHTDRPMQDTVGEWRRSDAHDRGVGCVDCHLRADDHAMRVIERPEVLAGAVDLRVRSCREGEGWRVEATVRATGVGHAVPTGDLHRQLRLVVGDGRVEATRVFTRRFEDLPRRDDRGEVHLARSERYDGRVAPPGPEAVDTVTLRVRARARPRWRLEHWRTTPEIAARQRLPLSLVRTLLSEGTSLPCDSP
jgi:hypothetical protein